MQSLSECFKSPSFVPWRKKCLWKELFYNLSLRVHHAGIKSLYLQSDFQSLELCFWKSSRQYLDSVTPLFPGLPQPPSPPTHTHTHTHIHTHTHTHTHTLLLFFKKSNSKTTKPLALQFCDKYWSSLQPSYSWVPNKRGLEWIGGGLGGG